MNIEVGKYYRMRCGGAVRIEVIKGCYAFSPVILSWDVSRKGKYLSINDSELDLVAEITEAEYDRIVSGELFGISEQFDDERLHDLQFEVEQLNNSNQSLAIQLAEITLKYNTLMNGDAFNRIATRVTDEQKEAVKSTLDCADEIANLKIEIEHLKFENNALSDIRRFEAAKAAMQGILATPGRLSITYEKTATDAVEYADALIKALEESK